ncbi:MAG: Undecaprenyl-phosphate 4-deoxy-4-formamido-L-arabinose transferase [Candidatus Woesebacteria bacterium GW2011_GWB1_43_14]|uniref:Undecaprenyl-phosphate 4-deoxy-4-formamido-L-arabinose transferase n=1 Tax=Candidatus Woesebacteria bacterium GW2011_GWB1_43_14 TaxID=1618578 RepID=A0A0G1DI27_9BACT|nr:MAG: Undecaprenyl-phosphate 4-deoxy-4-formamido-L-arabinose transferase [Candidatus Woesebacteria bacterium GW2011_GWA1_39_11b]KKS78355.1 MAG: Undecaprenyl-phosphate 4-deoxy-4-formamido-L-arabinose transferase [Candidatus Woesebacteria bacterium GW2011_GWC1_42_9]KKS97227.1 MAG: Undecaprenyl-phosphate 4-deoxy-4-formamido-L-arabinose transferase [Candidatus Woesebacteria bacterium GW2011_GWB1_43_14]
MNKVELSFIIPAKNEEKSVEKLYKKILEVISKTRKTYEIIFIDDGSTDTTFEVLSKLTKKNNKVKVIKLRGNFGKSTALQVGFERSRGKIVVTMDADLQDDPAELPKLLNKLEEGYDLVSGWKKQRYDPISKTLPSKIGNFATRLLTGISIHDLNCGYKVYRREVIENLNLYGELYKYIPVLAEKQNFKVSEVIVKHHKRKYGQSKFGWERNMKGFLDMITIVFLTVYLKRPAHFFGTWGIILFSSGFMIGLYITYLRIATGSIQYRHPLLFFGILLMIIGIQLVTTGLVAEMIVNLSQKKGRDVNFIDQEL